MRGGTAHFGREKKALGEPRDKAWKSSALGRRGWWGPHIAFIAKTTAISFFIAPVNTNSLTGPLGFSGSLDMAAAGGGAS